MGKKTTVLIFAYYSYKDPIFQSAVLPYFTDFPNKDNYKFILLTWEQKKYQLDKDQCEEHAATLSKHNIVWHSLRWHSGAFKLFKKAFDLCSGIIYSLFLILKYKIDLVYSEGFPGAILGHLIVLLTGRKHVVHTFEPHVDYMVEGGTWKSNSWEAILLRSFEKDIAKRCALVLTATDAYKKIIVSWGVDHNKIELVPSCVDTDFFTSTKLERKIIRAEQKIKDNEIVITYLGKFGGMYMEQELFQFFSVCEQNKDLNFRYFIFTGDDITQMRQWIKEFDLPEDKFLITYLSREEVPKYLSASDFGFVAVRPYPSKRFCSPIKDGEYWSCGLPIIIPAGISDDFEFTKAEQLGLVIDELNEASYQSCVVQIRQFMASINKAQIRNFAMSRDIKLYRKSYDRWFSELVN